MNCIAGKMERQFIKEPNFRQIIIPPIVNFQLITKYQLCQNLLSYVMYIMYIPYVDSSVGIPVQNLWQCPHSTNTQGYRDTVDYRDIFTVSIVIVKFSLSSTSIGYVYSQLHACVSVCAHVCASAHLSSLPFKNIATKQKLTQHYQLAPLQLAQIPVL